VARVVARAGYDEREARKFRALGLRSVLTLASGERTEDLLLDAGHAALDGQPAALVLYGHTLLTRRIDLFDAAFRESLRDRLALPDAAVYGLSHVNCVAVLRSVEFARRFLARRGASADDRVLVLGGEQGSVFERARVYPGRSVSGDAVAAVVVRHPDAAERSRYRYLGGADSRDTRFHRNLRMTPEEFATNTEAIRTHTLEVVQRAADAAGVGLDGIDWLMPGLGNRMVWTTFAGQSGFPVERICLDLLAERAHNFGADSLMGLEHAERAGRLRPGDRCALVATARGAYFQAVIVEVLDDES
jgi:3-oxoacyl-[acyl-carrier-protein] synthase-3